MFNKTLRTIYSFRNSEAKTERLLRQLQTFDWQKIADFKMRDVLANDVELLVALFADKAPGIAPDWVPLGKWIVAFMNAGTIKDFLANPNDLSNAKNLADELDLLLCASGNKQDIPVLSPQDLLAEFTAIEFKDVRSVVHTLEQIGSINDRITMYRVVVLSLVGLKRWQAANNFSWLQSLLLALLLRVAWSWYPRLSINGGKDQIFLFEQFYYAGIVVGLPIKKIVSEYFYGSVDATVYMYPRLGNVLEAFKQNSEQVPLDKSCTRFSSFAELVSGFEAKQSSVLPITKRTEVIVSYVNSIYPKESGNEDKAIWLQEALSLYQQIITGTLIDRLYIEEPEESRLFQSELIRLILYYLSDPVAWLNIIKYYQQPKLRVPLKVFLFQISIHENLNDKKVMERVLMLIEELRKENVLKENQDIIVYYESDKKFHWNEELLT